jgi:hypothetical protein
VQLIASLEKWKGQCEKNRAGFFLYFFGFLTFYAWKLSYLIGNGACFMTLCDSSYPRKLAFHYLQDLQKEFERLDNSLVEKITRPYSFVKFGNLCNPTLLV